MNQRMLPGQFIQSPQFTYQVISKIAQGTEGEVFKGINKCTQLPVAIKQQIRISEKQLNILNTLSKTKFTNVVNVLEVFFQNFSYFIVMELGQDSLRKLMISLKEEQKILQYFLQIAKGLEEIHSLGLIHRDLKPDNIVIFNNGGENLKICDLGLMIQKHDQKISRVGTPYYMAPEIIKTDFQDEKVDVWALGIVLYEMIKSQQFFSVQSEEELNCLVCEITQDQIDEKIDQIENCSQNTKDLLKCMLAKGSQDRLSCTSIIQRLDPEQSKENSLILQKEQDDLENEISHEQNLLKQRLEIEQENLFLKEKKEKLREKYNSELVQWEICQRNCDQRILQEQLQALKKELDEKENQNQEIQQQILEDIRSKDEIQTKSQLFFKKKINQTEQHIEEAKINFIKQLNEQFEIKKQKKIKEIEDQIDQQIKQEQDQEQQEKIRNLKFKMIQDKTNSKLNALEKASNLMNACETIVKFQIKSLIKINEEVPAADEDDEVFKAKLAISQLIKDYSIKQQQIKQDQKLLNQFSSKQITQIIEIYNRKIYEITQDQKQDKQQISQLIKVIRQSRISENLNLLQQQFDQLKIKLHQKQQKRQQQEKEIQDSIFQWNDKLDQSCYSSQEIKQKLSNLKKKFYNNQACQTQYYPIDDDNLQDQIYLINNQIDLIEEHIIQYESIKQDLRSFQQIFYEERDKHVNYIVSQHDLFIIENETQCRNYSFIKKINKDRYPKRIRQLKKQIEKNMTQRNLVLLKIPKSDSFFHENDEVLQNQNNLIVEIRAEIQELNAETQKLIQQLQEELHQFELEEQINIKKAQIVQELQKQLDFNPQIKQFQEQVKIIASQMREFMTKHDIQKYEQILNELDEKVRIDEGYIKAQQSKLYKDSEQYLTNNQDLQQLQNEYESKIQKVQSQLKGYQSQIAQLSTQLNQSFPKDICEKQLHSQAEQIKLILQLKITEKKNNLFYQKIIQTQDLKQTIYNRSVDEELKILRHKKLEFEKFQKEAEENIETQLCNRWVRDTKQHINIKRQLIKLINALGEKIIYCDLGIELSNQLDLIELKQSVNEMQNKLDEESKDIFVYQKWLAEIQEQLLNLNLEQLNDIFSEFRKRFVQRNIDSIEFDFKSKWEHIIELLKLQFKPVISIKCYSILLKQLEIKRQSEKLLEKKLEEQIADDCYQFAQKWLFYFQNYLTIILKKSYCQAEEEYFIEQYQKVDSESERKLEILQDLINQKNREIITCIQDQQLAIEITNQINLEANKIKLFNLFSKI